MSAPRKLAAILVADVAGYSRLTGIDEEGTLKRLRKRDKHAYPGACPLTVLEQSTKRCRQDEES